MKRYATIIFSFTCATNLLFAQQDVWTIDISDNAPEIAKEVAEQIFVPFFTTKTDGSGIGLSVSKRIMDLHNGSLQFIQPAKEPSCVKTFRMTLP